MSGESDFFSYPLKITKLTRRHLLQLDYDDSITPETYTRGTYKGGPKQFSKESSTLVAPHDATGDHHA